MSTILRKGMLIAVIVMLAAGCATAPGRGGDQAPLEVRAEQRWQRLLAGDWDAAYRYLTPGVRDVTSLDAYRDAMRNRRVTWKDARLRSVECEIEDRCVVSVHVEFDLVGGLPGTTTVGSFQTVEETWLRLDGVWYFIPRHAAN